MRLANPVDLVQAPGPATRNYGLLQTTGTQKALFRLPSFQQDVKRAARVRRPTSPTPIAWSNTKASSRTSQDAMPLNLGAFKTKILAEGYQLLDELNPGEGLPAGTCSTDRCDLVDEEFLKIYVEYSNNDKNGSKPRRRHAALRLRRGRRGGWRISGCRSWTTSRWSSISARSSG